MHFTFSLFISLATPAAVAAVADVGGKQLECKAAKQIKEGSTNGSPAVAYPDRGLIEMDKGMMNKAPLEARVHIFCHECGHLDGNLDETAADTYGILCAKAHGVDPEKTADAACKLLGDAPGDAAHPPGPQRCDNMKRVAQCASGGDGKSCLQGAQGDPVAVAGTHQSDSTKQAYSGGTSGGGSSSEEDSALAEVGKAWLNTGYQNAAATALTAAQAAGQQGTTNTNATSTHQTSATRVNAPTPTAETTTAETANTPKAPAQGTGGFHEAAKASSIGIRRTAMVSPAASATPNATMLSDGGTPMSLTGAAAVSGPTVANTVGDVRPTRVAALVRAAAPSNVEPAGTSERLDGIPESSGGGYFGGGAGSAITRELLAPSIARAPASVGDARSPEALPGPLGPSLFSITALTYAAHCRRFTLPNCP